MTLGIILIFVAIALIIGEDVYYFGRRMLRFQRRRADFQPQTWPFLRYVLRERQPDRRVSLAEIRDFVVNLQLATSLEQTLTGALAQTAEQLGDRGEFGRRLRQQVETRLSFSPEDVIAALAEDFDSEELRDLLWRFESAREGGSSYVEALEVTVETLERDIQTQVEREIQRAPLNLTLPMVIGIFFPAVALAAYPLVQLIVRQLAGSV